MKPTLKSPGINRLKLQYDEALSNSAFNFNLRRYIEGRRECRFVFASLSNAVRVSGPPTGQGLTLVHFSAQLEPYVTQKHTLNTPNTTPYQPPKHPRNNP